MIISSISTTSFISKTYKSWPFPNLYPVFIFNNFVKLLKMKKMLSSNNWLFNEKVNQSGHSPDTLPTRRLEKKNNIDMPRITSNRLCYYYLPLFIFLSGSRRKVSLLQDYPSLSSSFSLSQNSRNPYEWERHEVKHLSQE